MATGGPLIGRDAELAELEGMLARTRLLTVTGAGGCGKTRVALELADRVASAAGGLEYRLIELAYVASAEQLLDALLRAVGGRERFGSRPWQVLLDRLADRRMLFVLDNCEHLLAIAGRLVGELLQAAPAVQVLATSREPLGIEDESVFRLGPLSVPGDDGGIGAVVRSDAGRLFVERAARADAAFVLTPETARAVARICRELDGLPLALCLAAGRVQTLSASEAADGLARSGRLSVASDAEGLPQHRSVRASLEWSYSLLEEREQALLRGLSSFAGGFTVAAANAVAAPRLSETRVRVLLDALEAKGLIVALAGKDGERWTFLETVREFASEQLAAEGEVEELADRHLAWFCAYAETADSLLLDDGHALIDEEAANVRLALALAFARDASSAVQLVAALTRHWILAEHFEEARAASAAALSAAGAETDAPERAVLHCAAGVIAMLGEDYAGAVGHTRMGLELVQQLDEPAAVAQCLQLSSMVLIETGLDLEEGLRNGERAVELQRSLDDPVGLAFALVNLAMAATLCERFDAVRSAYEEFLSVPAACEHPRLRTWGEHAAGWAEIAMGSPARGLVHSDRALALEGELPSMTHFQVVSLRIHALARLGRVQEALEEGERALVRARDSGALQAIPAIELALMVADYMRGEFGAAKERARALLEVPQVHTLALAHELLARMALARGDANEAAARARELEALAQRSGSARQHALAQWIAGCAARLAGELDRARELLHAALARDAELGLERDAADVLDELALLAASAGEGERAARLAAAAAAVRTRLGCTPLPRAIERLQEARTQCEGCAADAWETAWQEGSALSLASAIAYARRRRGRRDRPAEGWESLTPAELGVAQLAASGISNPQIAAQLFISRSTVKMHLSNVYVKLHVANRVELAAAMAKHSPEAEGPLDREPQLA